MPDALPEIPAPSAELTIVCTYWVCDGPNCAVAVDNTAYFAGQSVGEWRSDGRRHFCPRCGQTAEEMGG